MWSQEGSAFAPISVTILPLSVTRPSRIRVSALRRDTIPAPAMIFWSLTWLPIISQPGLDSLRLRVLAAKTGHNPPQRREDAKDHYARLMLFPRQFGEFFQSRKL